MDSQCCENANRSDQWEIVVVFGKATILNTVHCSTCGYDETIRFEIPLSELEKYQVVTD